MAESRELFDAVIVGGGPAGATAAHELASKGRRVLLLDRGGRVKPCGGAVPPQLLKDFDVPDSLLVARVMTARMVSPRGERVDMDTGHGIVGMVDREQFDEWLRSRAAAHGAERRTGVFTGVSRDADGTAVVEFVDGRSRHGSATAVRARTVIGADGALSKVAKACIPRAGEARYVFAYHEIIETPGGVDADMAPDRADVIYDSRFSPDFYAWIFPHGHTASIGTGTEQQGFDMKGAIATLRAESGLSEARTIRREGAPIPLRPLKRWDNGRDVVLAGDAAGVVSPASGEGIFYAMTGGRLAAEAVEAALDGGGGRALAEARRRFMAAHGQTFRVLEIMQRFWYTSDARRERFVAICKDKDVQRLTFDGYMNKKLVKAEPLAHARIFLKNIGHLTGLARI